MDSNRLLPRRLGTTLVAAALSLLIAIGLVSVVAELFLREGTPWEHVVAVERACDESRFVSEREACMRSSLEDSHDRVARR